MTRWHVLRTQLILSLVDSLSLLIPIIVGWHPFLGWSNKNRLYFIDPMGKFWGWEINLPLISWHFQVWMAPTSAQCQPKRWKTMLTRALPNCATCVWTATRFPLRFPETSWRVSVCSGPLSSEGKLAKKKLAKKTEVIKLTLQLIVYSN